MSRRARRREPLRKPPRCLPRPPLGTAGGEKPGFPLLGPRTMGQRVWDCQSGWEPPSALRLLLALPVKPAGPVGHTPLPASSGMQGILRESSLPRPRQQCGGMDLAAPTPQNPPQTGARGKDAEAGEDVQSRSNSTPAFRDAAKQGPGLPKLCTAPAIPARLSGALHSHKPASTPIICFLKKMRFV